MASIDTKKPLPQQMQDKFEILNNTFKQRVKDNPKDRLEVEIGDSKQPDFKPQVKIMRWDNEVNFSIRAQEHPSAKVEIDGEVIKYITPEYEVHQYDKPDASEDGGNEFEWLLLKKPLTSVITATIQSKELDFFYQPPLTQEEIDKGVERPDYVIGSYAVYHKTKGSINNVRGLEYKSGKAFHIYRPQATDSKGDRIWCNLNIDESNGILTITIDDNWLQNAEYPVIVDPTFGYTSVGATTDSTSPDAGQIGFGRDSGGTRDFMALFKGEIISISFAGSSNNVARPVVYRDEATNSLISYGNEVTLTSGSFKTMPVNIATIYGGTDYRLGWWTNTANTGYRYDTVSNDAFSTVNETYSSTNPPTDPCAAVSGSSFNRRVSIYATYDGVLYPGRIPIKPR